MEKVYVLGVGMHPFGRFPDKSFGELGRVATNNALRDAGIDWKDIQIVYSTSMLQGAAWGTKIARACGARGIPVINMEAACCSTSAATALARYAIAAEDQPYWAANGLGHLPVDVRADDALVLLPAKPYLQMVVLQYSIKEFIK